MPGIYIHIPFCKQACHYCDFHFSTSLKNKEAFLSALKKEISFQKDYFSLINQQEKKPSDYPSRLSTVYFGGGTPSLLSQKEILEIFEELNRYFSIDEKAEVTLEANPDDLTREKIAEIKSTPVNRLSIGIQSFSDTDLNLLNRAHNPAQAVESVKSAQDAGFENITIDLIYGIPTLSNEQWKKNLEIAFSLNVPHISAYSLTVEPKTALASFIKKGKIENIDDDRALQQFEMLISEMEKNNFIHYEISNFCKRISVPPEKEEIPGALNSPAKKVLPYEKDLGWASKHNSSYWRDQHYLGLGPSAHSYNGSSRQWNAANNTLYIKSLEKNELNFEREILTGKDKYNEYILTSLRTIWGCDLDLVKTGFGEKIAGHLLKNAQPYILQNRLNKNDTVLTLTQSGKFIADKIARDLFL